MTRSRSRRVLGLALSGALTVSALAATSAPTTLAANAAEPTVTVTPGGDLLDAPVAGSAAVRALGDDLPVAAARNDMTARELRTLLRSDDSARVDTRGRLHYVDPAPTRSQLAAMAESGAATAPAPLADTFALHSLPGANLTIYLDFDGATVQGTGWNSAYGVPAGAHPAWDPAGDGPAFNDAERTLVQQVWAMVAEDYAPFNVNVTTQDPGDAALVRSSASDTVYGTRVLITPSTSAQGAICPSGCGGVAYVNTFAVTSPAYQPAWVFPHMLGHRAKGVGEAASHEAGHNLGLGHDGVKVVAGDPNSPTAPQGYYRGHGHWAPIMGAGYDRAVSQWSRGNYAYADNQQDDLATIGGFLGTRVDEAPSEPGSAAPLPTGHAYITTPTDVDAFHLGTCTPGSTVRVDAAPHAPNLDVRAQLVDAQGVTRVTADPPSGAGDKATATGMGAPLTVPSAPAASSWRLVVDGVGHGTWADGYDDYGSLGAYTVHAPECSKAPPVTDVAPSAPTNVQATSTGSTATLTWAPPADPGSAPVDTYLVTINGTSTTLGAAARSHTFTNLAAGATYTLSVAARSSAGTGPAAQVDVTTAKVAPGAPTNLTGSYDPVGDSLLVHWTPPADEGTHPVTSYSISVDGEPWVTINKDVRDVAIALSVPFTERAYVVDVTATSAAGTSPPASVSITVQFPPPDPPGTQPPGTQPPGTQPPVTQPPSAPATPARPRVVVRGRKVIIKWRAPADHGSPIKRYRVDFSKGKDRTVKAGRTRLVVKRFRHGRFKVRIRAINGVGRSAFSRRTTFRVR